MMPIFQSDVLYPHKIYRIWAIEGITGLKDLDRAFDNHFGSTEVELIVDFLKKKYHLANGGNEDVYDFIINTLQFSDRALNIIEVNYPEFFNCTTIEEACSIILTKLLDTTKNILNKNGFPKNLNVDRSQFNNTIFDKENNKFYTCVNNDISFSFNKMLTWLLNGWKFDNKNFTCLYHGASWSNTFFILNNGVKSLGKVSDFGKNSFYMTDTFLHAFKISKQNQQSAIVLFFIPNEFLLNLENKLEIEDLESWKQLVFKARNPPSFSGYKPLVTEYNNFIDDLDSKSLIKGPIFANPGTESVEDVQYIGGGIPKQYAFKERTYTDISSFIAGTILFQSFF